MMSSVISSQKNRVANQFVVLDSSKRFSDRLGGRRSIQISKMCELDGAIQQSSNETVWIASRSSWAERLSKAVSSHVLRQQKSSTFGVLLMLEPARPELLPPLHSQFRQVVGEVSDFRMLPADQLADVLSSKNKSDLFIGGIVDQHGGTITLARGDLSTVTLPLSIFTVEGPCKPDFGRFEVDDYGYTLRFGDYEASAHSALYLIDPEYRRRANKQRIESERGFGPSLRRLRILKRLSREDFSGISPKTVARIERGETEKPQGKTLETLAKALGVKPGEIETY